MLAKLITYLAQWVGAEAERQTEAAIISGVQRGARNALLKLTGGELDPADLLTVQAVTEARGERLESTPQTGPGGWIGPEPSPALPTFTRTQIHNLKRDELVELVERQQWPIDLDLSVKDIKAAVLQELGI